MEKYFSYHSLHSNSQTSLKCFFLHSKTFIRFSFSNNPLTYLQYFFSFFKFLTYRNMFLFSETIKVQPLHNISPISGHSYQCAYGGKLKSERTLRGCVNQSEMLQKVIYFKEIFFFSKITSQHCIQLATSLLFPVIMRYWTYTKGTIG